MAAASIDTSDEVPFLSSEGQALDMIEGNIFAPPLQSSNGLSTLDEPVLETIKRS